MATVSTDFTRPFSINGLEFDLAELELYENRSKSKTIPPSHQASDDCVDDLDEYLEHMALHTADIHNDDCTRTNATPMPSTSAACNGDNSDIACHSTNAIDSTAVENVVEFGFDKTTFPLLLFGFLGILAFVNSVHCKRI